MLDHKKRYLQLAFNNDLSQALRVLQFIPPDERVLIEAGTPFIKREGLAGVRRLSQAWEGVVVADLKTTDGAEREVILAAEAGAKAATVLGSAPTETIDLFIRDCGNAGLTPMVDMLGVQEPLKVMMRFKKPPSVVILHKGRDEEATRGKTIAYKQVAKIKSKFAVLISAAGGVDLREARSAIFNGANIVVVNIVSTEDPWTGIKSDSDVEAFVNEFLDTIE
ncbi:hypothetical protein J4220_01825 [Candidatus Micrarchaeota archaeon]|nr:hypothetical protein [Candidatus Micrarchaeota archaeon]